VVGATAAAALFVFMVVLLGPVNTLVAILFLIAALILLRFPIVGIYALVVLLPFNGLISQVAEGTAIPGLYGAAKDFLLLGILLVAIISGRVRRVPATVVATVALIVTLALVSGIFTSSVLQASYGWRNDYEPLLLLIAVPAIVDLTSVRRILALVIVMAQVSAGIAVASWSRGLEWLFDIGRLPVANQDDFPTSLFSSGSIRPRAFSPYVAPNEMAVVMAALLAVVWLIPGLRGWQRILLSVLPVAAVVLSESRSGILGAIVLACVLAARGLHKRSAVLAGAFLLMAVVGVVSGAVLYITNLLDDGGDPSIGGHSLSLESGIATLMQNPFGLGLGRVGPRAAQYDDSYHVESFWLLIGLESGIVVMVLYVALMGYLVTKSVRSSSDLSFTAAAVISASLVSQLVLPAFQEGAVSFTVWLLVGLAFVSIKAEADMKAQVVIEKAPSVIRLPR
jgi:hypothetical protein